MTPTTAREALDLAWDLAHPVREGQVIPAGSWVIHADLDDDGAMEVYKTGPGILEPHKEVGIIRTFDPLPDPLPKWTKAPAVLAATIFEDRSEHRTVFARENKTGTQWLRDTKVYRWDELTDVVPLYPKGQDA